jgi:xylan 1,4-beta-xylosidase
MAGRAAPQHSARQYYIKDLPAKDKGAVSVQISGLMKGDYILSVSQVGYKKNDAYTAYIGMGSPAQLTKAQVTTLEAEAIGRASRQERVAVGESGVFTTELPLRENDVYLLELARP